jgi:hypothetical protein
MATTCIVTATICDPSQTSLLGNALVRFRLRNFVGSIPIVSGTSVVCEDTIDSYPSPAGAIVQTITCNTAISPVNTFYTVEFWNQGRIISSGNYIFNANTSLNTVSNINPAPAPAGPSAIIFENNGVLNSSQTLLNLESTNGSVAITDQGGGNINLAATGASFSTSGSLGFWGPGVVNVLGLSNAGGSIGVTANLVSVWAFVLQASWTVRKISFIVEGPSGGQTVNFGIYNSAGAKLIDSGALSGTSLGLVTAVVTPTTLAPGTYYFAQSSTNGGITCRTFVWPSTNSPATNTQEVLLNQAGQAIGVGQAANPTSAGSMPATLGTITADTLGLGAAYVYFTP